MSRIMIGRFLALAVSLVLAMPGAAAVQEQEKVGVLRNKETGFVLVSNAKDVYTQDDGGAFAITNAIQWQFIRSDDGSYVLRNKATGFVLDSNAAKDVYPHDANGGAFQQWQFTRSDDGSYVLRNKATGFVLDSDRAKHVYTHDANGGAFQQWRIEGTQL